jgi:hypothetical protein
MSDAPRAHALFEAEEATQRYVLGQLPAAERAAFEEHFLDCPECLDRLELERSLREGLARADTARPAAALESSERVQVEPVLGPPAARALRPRAFGLRLALAAALAVAVSALLLREWLQARRELAAWQREARLTSPDDLHAERARWQALLEQERRQAAQERVTAERARAQLEAALAQAREPAARTLMLSLEPERGQTPGLAQISLPAQPALIVLALSSGAAAEPVTLALHSSERQVWQGSAQAEPDGSVWLALPSAWLPAGHYTLTLTRARAGGAQVERFAFRVRAATR